MRKLLIAVAACAATAALPATAAAAETGPPETCDYIKNTICHLIPPTSVEDVCAIVDATTNLTCNSVNGSFTGIPIPPSKQDICALDPSLWGLCEHP